MSEKTFYLFDVVLARYYEKVLVFLYDGLRCRDYDFFILPYSGYHEMTVCALPYIHDCLSEDGRIADLVLCYECVVRRCVLMLFAFFAEDSSEEYHAEDHSDESERIADCACHRHVVRSFHILRIDLEECLLGCTEHRGVCYGSR